MPLKGILFLSNIFNTRLSNQTCLLTKRVSKGKTFNSYPCCVVSSYPIYQRGNPQLRVFLPNFWMKLVRSENPLPPNQVLFQTSIQMTRQDVWNYLEKIYKIPIVDIKIEIKMGAIKNNLKARRLMKEDDYKEALVTMPRDVKFVFPDVAKDVEAKQEMERYNKIKDTVRQAQHENKHRPGVPSWFYI